MKKQIYPCLWFDGRAKEAALFYCSVFKNARITFDSPMVVKWDLDGVEFMGLNGGAQFQFNESFSYVIECDNQEEIDYYWEKLIEGGGRESMCGWLKDKFGLSWQVVPAIIGQLMSDSKRAPRVMAEVQKMRKLDIATMLNA